MNPILSDLYHKYLSDDDCPSFIKNTARHYMVGTIEKLTESSSRMTRRAAILALGFLGDYSSNTPLGQALSDPDATVRSMTEHAIQQVWFRTGNGAQQKELLVLERLNLAQQFDKVIDRSTRLIENNPDIAEACNQRSIAHFNLLLFPDAIRDCRETLKLNSFHYPAAMGMGHCYLEINEIAKAIDSFDTALGLNPGLNLVRAQINFLKKNLKLE